MSTSMEEYKQHVINTKSFSRKVESLVSDKPMPYMDAILLSAEKLGLEIELAAKYVNKNIKQKLEEEASELNLMQPCAKLPL